MFYATRQGVLRLHPDLSSKPVAYISSQHM